MLVLPLVLGGLAVQAVGASSHRSSRRHRHIHPVSNSRSEPNSTTTTDTTTDTFPQTHLSTRSVGEWSYQGCRLDSLTRILSSTVVENSAMLPARCISYCGGLNYTYAGVENGTSCFCGASLGIGAQVLDDALCETPCGGGGLGCGGAWALSLWYRSAPLPVQTATSSIISSSSDSGSSSQSSISSAPSSSITTASSSLSSTLSSSTTTTSASSSSTSSISSSASNFPPIAGSGSTKYVWAHHIVGNTYSYDYGAWLSDVYTAYEAGIDGFVLNVGTDSWQPSQVANAYAAAAASGTGFKMMLSFDMSVFGCSDVSSVSTLQSYLSLYLYHSAAATVNSQPAVTTFSGGDCTFGTSSVNAGWASVFGSNANAIYFMPDYNTDPTTLSGQSIQAEVNWGAAWPTGATDIDTSTDTYYMGLLGSKGYVATISPLFNTHLSYKNWIYRSDDFLFSMRWEQVLSMRDRIDQVEVVSWNDYGESHYIGPIEGSLPSGSEQYVDNFPHSDLLSLNNFYAQAWKTGSYPTVTADAAWIMARPHPASAVASADPYGLPNNAAYTTDNFYTQVHLTSAASVTLCAGSSCQTWQGVTGINRFSLPMVVGQGIGVWVNRNGKNTVSVVPNFTFNGSPTEYNFNYLIQSS